MPKLLGEQELAKVLIEKKLISRREFVRGDIRFTFAERRNRNVKVIVKDAEGLFTKQAKTEEAITTLRHEASVLNGLCATQDDLSKYITRNLEFDFAFSLLVSPLIANGHSMHDIFMQQKHVELEHSKVAGAALAHLHNRHIPANSYSMRIPPYTLELNRPHYTLLRNLSPANERLLEAIQNDEELSAGLDGLRANWTPTSLIHGDAKLDNMVVAPHAFLLVDWELAIVGDPRWDVGTVFSSLLSSWIASMPMAHGANLELMTRQAWLPFSAVAAAARPFWLTYATTRGLDPSRGFLEQATSYCGGRLVQTAYEYMQHAPRLTANAIHMIQLAANILKDPSRAVQLLLGK